MKANSYFFLLIFYLIAQRGLAQVPNGGFESWYTDVDNNVNPESWETTNSFPLVSVEQYTPAYAGNYSMRVKAFDAGGFTVAGIAYTNFTMTSRPTHIRCCLKCTVMPGDYVYVMFGAWNGDSTVAATDSCTFKFDSTITNFTCFNLPIRYVSQLNPDSITILVSGGNLTSAQLGTEVVIDEISFLGVGINETENISSVIKAYPSPALKSLTLDIPMKKSSSLVIHIYDSSGRLIQTTNTEKLPAGLQSVRLNIDQLPQAIYNCKVEGDGFSGACMFAKTE